MQPAHHNKEDGPVDLTAYRLEKVEQRLDAFELILQEVRDGVKLISERFENLTEPGKADVCLDHFKHLTELRTWQSKFEKRLYIAIGVGLTLSYFLGAESRVAIDLIKSIFI